jgi:hypothetical protein
MGRSRTALAPSRSLGLALALVGSGIAFGALFLPWDYYCQISVTVCSDSGPQEHANLVPIFAMTSHVFLAAQLPLLLPFFGLTCALLTVYLPSPRRRAAGVLALMVGSCGVFCALTAPLLDGFTWLTVPGTLNPDWGIAVSALGYVVLLVGICFLPLPRVRRAEDAR